MTARRKTEGEGWEFVPVVPEPDAAARETSLPPEQHRLRVRTEKRAKGKLVTVVGPFALTPADLTALATALKKACGTGGTVHDEQIELQGDCVERARSWLAARGYGA